MCMWSCCNSKKLVPPGLRSVTFKECNKDCSTNYIKLKYLVTSQFWMVKFLSGKQEIYFPRLLPCWNSKKLICPLSSSSIFLNILPMSLMPPGPLRRAVNLILSTGFVLLFSWYLIFSLSSFWFSMCVFAVNMTYFKHRKLQDGIWVNDQRIKTDRLWSAFLWQDKLLWLKSALSLVMNDLITFSRYFFQQPPRFLRKLLLHCRNFLVKWCLNTACLTYTNLFDERKHFNCSLEKLWSWKNCKIN